MGCVNSTAEPYDSSDDDLAPEVLGAAQPRKRSLSNSRSQSKSMEAVEHSRSVESVKNPHPPTCMVRLHDKTIRWYENGRDIGQAAISETNQHGLDIWDIDDYEKEFGTRKHLAPKHGDLGDGKIYQRPDGSYGLLVNGHDTGTVTAIDDGNGDFKPVAGQNLLAAVDGSQMGDGGSVYGGSQAPSVVPSVHPPSINGNRVVTMAPMMQLATAAMPPSGSVAGSVPCRPVIHAVPNVQPMSAQNAGSVTVVKQCPANKPCPVQVQPVRFATAATTLPSRPFVAQPVGGVQPGMAIMYTDQGDNRSVISEQPSGQFPSNASVGNRSNISFDNRPGFSAADVQRFDGRNFHIAKPRGAIQT